MRSAFGFLGASEVEGKKIHIRVVTHRCQVLSHSLDVIFNFQNVHRY